MKVSVIIPTHQRRASLERTVSSLRGQTYPSGLIEIIVAADRCTDGTVEWLSSQDSAVVTTVATVRPGAAAARNAGLGAASGELAVFLDDDMEADPGLIAAHVAAHAAAGGERCIVIGYSPVHLSGDSSSLVRAIGRGFQRYFESLERYAEEPRDQGITGGNISIPTAALKEIGGFDESLRYREDLDLGIRLRRRGLRLRYEPAARVIQHVDVTAADMLARAAPRAKADLVLLEKYPDETHLLELHRAMRNRKARRSFRVFWHCGAMIDRAAASVSHAFPDNERLRNWRYRARYAQAAREGGHRWRDLREMLSADSRPRDRIRIMHLLGSSSPGGIETFVTGLVPRAGRERFHHSVCILDNDGPAAAQLREAGAEVHLLGRDATSLRGLAEYREILRDGYHILHAHAGGRAHRYLARHGFGMKVIRHLHGIEERWIESVRAADARARTLFDRTFAGCDAGLVCSSWLATRISSAAPRLQTRISVFRYGVDMARFTRNQDDELTRRTLGITPGVTVIGFVGRMVAQKGVLEFLDVVRAITENRDDVIAVLVGGGPLLADAKRKVRELRLHSVRFAGEQVDVAPYVRIFDVLAVPSRWEPFGIVSLEAMSASKPVVAYAVDGIPEALSDGETGFLVEPGNDSEFADALVKLLDDPALRSRLGRAGRDRVERYFAVERIPAAMGAFYDDVLRGASPMDPVSGGPAAAN